MKVRKRGSIRRNPYLEVNFISSSPNQAHISTATSAPQHQHPSNRTMNLVRMLFSSILIFLLVSSSFSYIPVRLIAKFIPFGSMYGGFLATSGLSKLKLPSIRLGDHHGAVHVYPTEHLHTLKSHSAHHVSSDHGHHHGHHGHHLPTISLGHSGLGIGLGLGGAGFGGLNL